MTLSVRRWGDPTAPVVVFLHGLGLLGPRVTDEPAEAWAARGFHVLAPDLPGFGGSPAVSREDYRPSRLARLLLDELPEHFALVGFSWGGTIGCHLAVQAPQRLRALVLVDVGYQSAPPEPTRYEQLLEEARAEREQMRFADPSAFLVSARPYFSPRISDSILLASMREQAGELVPELTAEVYASALHGVQTEPPQALHGALREAELPILLLVAGRPPDEQRAPSVLEFGQAVPTAEVRHYPDAGHNVLLDVAEVALDDVSVWLNARLARPA